MKYLVLVSSLLSSCAVAPVMAHHLPPCPDVAWKLQLIQSGVCHHVESNGVARSSERNPVDIPDDVRDPEVDPPSDRPREEPKGRDKKDRDRNERAGHNHGWGDHSAGRGKGHEHHDD